MEFVVEQFRRGGPVMWPLGALAVFSLTFILERLWTYLRVPKGEGAERLLREAEEAVRNGEVPEGISERWGIFAYAFLAVLRRLEGLRTKGRGYGELRTELLQAADEACEEYLGRFLPILSTAGTVAPLLGLLGTILGMIRAFGAIARVGVGDPSVVASGISEALITTAAGLIIAVPTIIAHRYLSARARRTMRRASQYAHRFVDSVLEAAGLTPEGGER